MIDIFAGIDKLTVAVIGDFCLDVYWEADMRISELSRETPHFPLPIVSEHMSAGGAGNVAINIAALMPKKVAALGVTGSDWRADALISCLSMANVDISGLIHDDSRVTNCYIKPLRRGFGDVIYEDPRLDFENRTALSESTEEKLLKAIDSTDFDILCVCDQLRFGCITEKVRAKLCELGKSGKRIIVDSRDRISLYKHVIVKPNEIEALRALDSSVPYENAVQLLSGITQKPAIITLGADGCLVCEDDKVTRVPAFKAEPPLDICGAGDTFLAALACMYGSDASLIEAARVANAASNVTVRKLHVTGTASREEIAQVLEK